MFALVKSSPAGGTNSAVCRVNVPHFDGEVCFAETAIFWFGRITPIENHVKVRVGYNDDFLYLHLATFDRRLWCDTSHSAEDLTAWDTAKLYLDLGCNAASLPDASSFRFQAQLVWWEPRQSYEAARRGDGGGWVAASVPFATTSSWRGNAPNNDVDDRGRYLWWTDGMFGCS